MPLLDHFHAPVKDKLPWDSFHSNWATRIADLLNDRWLPAQFIASEHTHSGAQLEIDVATWERTEEEAVPSANGAVATLPKTWTPPMAQHTIPTVFPDTFEVRVVNTVGGLTLVAAIELVSPANKDRPDTRRAFATKCASYLHQGVSLVLVDVVTEYRANLHNEIMQLMQADAATEIASASTLYATAYRPVLRADKPQTDIWTASFALGDPLPTMPLRLTGDLFVPVEFEASYVEACKRRRLI
jgi:hypothetical protein